MLRCDLLAIPKLYVLAYVRGSVTGSAIRRLLLNWALTVPVCCVYCRLSSGAVPPGCLPPDARVWQTTGVALLVRVSSGAA